MLFKSSKKRMIIENATLIDPNMWWGNLHMTLDSHDVMWGSHHGVASDRSKCRLFPTLLRQHNILEVFGFRQTIRRFQKNYISIQHGRDVEVWRYIRYWSLTGPAGAAWLMKRSPIRPYLRSDVNIVLTWMIDCIMNDSAC